MLRIIITNERQRREYSHDGERLLLGRAPGQEENSLIIDDPYVSREQLVLEELPNDQVRVENVGRNTITLADDATISQGESRQIQLPARLAAGKTVLDVCLQVDTGTYETVGQTLFVSDFSGLTDLILENVCQSYPYPLAYGYRLLGSITNPAERYREQLRTVENLVAFLGTLSLSVAVDSVDGDAINQQRGQSILESWRGGISPGNWLDITIHSLAAIDDDDINPLARSLRGLKINESHRGFGKLVRQLIKAKNDHKHDRGPSVTDEYEEQSKSLSDTLRMTLNHLSFLANHATLLVQEVNPHRRGDKADVLFLNCKGDHPGFATETSVHSSRLRKDDLYIQVDEENLAPLFPFMHAKMCRQCKTREFFFVDRLDKKKHQGAETYEAGLKSFERGHTDQDVDMGGELKHLFGGKE